MTPFWIVNFLEKDSCESFFMTYWSAFLQNNPDAKESDRFFYITDGTDPEMTEERLWQQALRLSVDIDGSRLIPVYEKLQKDPSNQDQSCLNVLFLGDVTNRWTIERFHLWATTLWQRRLKTGDAGGGDWGNLKNVHFYGLLWRPDSATVAPGIGSNSRRFLNELATLQNLDINHRPFHHLLFLQSSGLPERRQEAEHRVFLAAYHIARTNGLPFTENTNRECLHDANSSAVFFEGNVQRDQEASLLGLQLMDDLRNGSGPEFFNTQEAERYVDANSEFIASFTPDSIASSIVAPCKRPSLDKLSGITRPCHPLNLKALEVWRKYYNGYVVNLKRNLVNTMRREMLTYEEEYRNTLYKAQTDNVTQLADGLEQRVFAMFSGSGDRKYFPHISIPQSIEVLRVFKQRIDAERNTDDCKVHAFPLDKAMAEAHQAATRNGNSSGDVLNVLVTRLRRLPLYNFARLLRILLFSLMLGYAVALITALWWPMAAIVAVVLIIDLLLFNSQVKRIERLKEQYIACRLMELRNILDGEIDHCIKKTYSDLDAYTDWLRTHKLEHLQQSLTVIPAGSFNFTVSPVFQPLNTQDTTRPTPNATLIVKDSPLGNINTPQGKVLISDLKEQNKDIVQKLLQMLMEEQEQVGPAAEKKVAFETHEEQRRSILLLLDVSGSMDGLMDDLKGYVGALSGKAEVEWIAFEEKIVATSRDGGNIERLQATGGTCYSCAINKAIEMAQTTFYDDIILVSDGYPTEPIDSVMVAATQLAQPLNTISVGTGAETVLIQIAHETGGTEITIDNFSQLRQDWEHNILPRIVGTKAGSYTFGELMRKGHIPGCAKALRSFALKQLRSTNLTTSSLLQQYGDRAAIEEWHLATTHLSDLTQSAPVYPTTLHCAEAIAGEPDMIVSLLAMRTIERIGDLLWAGFPQDDTTVDNIHLSPLMQPGYPVCNIYTKN